MHKGSKLVVKQLRVAALLRTLLIVSIMTLGNGTALAVPGRSHSGDQPAVVANVQTGVGFEELRVPNGTESPLVAGIWYPTIGEPRDVPVGSFTQRVVPAGPISGRALPLIVLSHGGGGSYAGHYDTALALARSGFASPP